ncbi:MFS transporter [Virgibacillus halophilus]
MLNNKQRFLVVTLTLLTFIMGTSEFVIVGLLTEVASDLKITLAAAGTLVSAFAISYAVGTPILTALLSKFSKYPLMLVLTFVFVLANMVSALADTYMILLISRMVTAVVSGVLIAMSMTIANSTMPAAKKPAIVALIFAGFAVANVFGVPLGTFIGQLENWHLSFWLTALLGVVVFIIGVFAIPRNLVTEKTSLKEQLKLLTYGRVILAFFIPAFGAAATFTIYTYITPMIENGMSVPTRFVGIILLVFGVFTIFSNVLSGKIAGKNGVGKLRYTFIMQAVILSSLYFTMNTMVAGLINIMFVALMFYVMNAPIQLYFMNFAETYSPAMKDFASSLTPVAINVGIALGSFVGNFVVEHSSFIHLSWAGGLEALVASGLSFIIYGWKQRNKTD